ncbi:hypothetical protein AVEN_190872-1 [Araneus ventricosus]|uniref:Uncharacterized protein n=1 Tax=Araneus ventricosus TaxID=182803 RepID=A0A4Y2CQL6_ARAVE|nr:hypothetical protein AVEN_190872-1 [Araneus ventricosus]
MQGTFECVKFLDKDASIVSLIADVFSPWSKNEKEDTTINSLVNRDTKSSLHTYLSTGISLFCRWRILIFSVDYLRVVIRDVKCCFIGCVCFGDGARGFKRFCLVIFLDKEGSKDNEMYTNAEAGPSV